MLPSVTEMEAYIRREATRLGINPDVAVEVARSEGLSEGTWQAKGNLSYGRERSYGPFQLHNAPPGEKPGMGNDFVKATGLDPSSPDTWDEGTTFALEQARKQGWGPWMGAAKAGIKGMYGIGQAPSPAQPGLSAPPPVSPVQPGLSAPMPSAPGLLDAPSQQDYSVSPSQEPGKTDWAALAKMAGQMGEKVTNDAQADTQQTQWLTPQVLQPMRRIQLGKGLLG